MSLLELREAGLYCAAGDFYIDPWDPVERAVITHAHADRARGGSRQYLTASPGEALLREQIGNEAPIQTARYGEPVTLGGVRVSLHPAGHNLGSAQVRIERGGEVWVAPGDYKLAPDPTCAPFEPLRCHTFVTGAPFGLPIFRWPAAEQVCDEIHAWWRANQEAGKTSVLFAEPLGAAQRLLAMLDASIGPIHADDAVERWSGIYRAKGIALAPNARDAGPRAMILGGQDYHAVRSGKVSTALASGWMRIRGTRRRRSLDRGFVFSDHADWPALLGAIAETGAETVWVTHGFRAPLVRWLEEHGRHAVAVAARYEETEQ